MAEQKGGSLAHQLLPGTELHALEGLADRPKTEDAVEMSFYCHPVALVPFLGSFVGGSFRDGSFQRKQVARERERLLALQSLERLFRQVAFDDVEHPLCLSRLCGELLGPLLEP